MLLNDYLRLRNQQISITTGTTELQKPEVKTDTAIRNNEGNTFAEALTIKLQDTKFKGGVEFSNHALKRIDSRSIDMINGDKLDRLNKGVEMAAEKGSRETLVLIDSTAFVVSVKNNKVITTLGQDDLKGNVFTNIDSTIII